MPRYLTTKQIGALLDAPQWEVRRVVDGLRPPVARLGMQRMVPFARLEEIRKVLSERRQRKRGTGNA
jgi:hypothetical protein